MELGAFVVPSVDRHRNAQMVVQVRRPLLVSETHRETPAKEVKTNTKGGDGRSALYSIFEGSYIVDY